MMSSCRENSILQNVCKRVFIFLYIIIYLLYWLLIFTNVHAHKKTCKKLTMPLNFLRTPIPFGIRNGIIWIPASLKRTTRPLCYSEQRICSSDARIFPITPPKAKTMCYKVLKCSGLGYETKFNWASGFCMSKNIY